MNDESDEYSTGVGKSNKIKFSSGAKLYDEYTVVLC